MDYCDVPYPIYLLGWMAVMTGSKLFHDQQVAAGEYVRIWQGEDGNLFEHVYPTGQSITIRCGTLDEAQSLLAQLVHEEPELDTHSQLPMSVYRAGVQNYERL